MKSSLYQQRLSLGALYTLNIETQLVSLPMVHQIMAVAIMVPRASHQRLIDLLATAPAKFRIEAITSPPLQNWDNWRILITVLFELLFLSPSLSDILSTKEENMFVLKMMKNIRLLW